jgi:hypothetical protein
MSENDRDGWISTTDFKDLSLASSGVLHAAFANETRALAADPQGFKFLAL